MCPSTVPPAVTVGEAASLVSAPAQGSPGRRRPYRSTLSNGLRVVVLPAPAPAPVALSVTVRAGSRDQAGHADGLAHLVEHLMFGWAEREAGHLGAVEAIGGMSNATTSPDVTTYSTVCAPEAFGRIVELEGRRMVAPEFTPQALRREVPVLRAEIAETARRSHGGFPWARLHRALEGAGLVLPHGSVGTIGALELTDAVRFHDDHYTAPRTTVTVVGDLAEEEAVHHVERAFGGLRRPGRAEPLSAGGSDTITGHRVEHRVRAVQVPEAAVAVPLPVADTSDLAVYPLLSQLLKHRCARFRREHSSTVSSASVECGYNGRSPALPDLEILLLRVRAATEDPGRWARELLYRELESLAGQGPDPDELRRAEAALLLRYMRELDDVGTAAVSLGRAEAVLGGAESFLGLPPYLAAVTDHHVRNAARRALEAPHGTVTLKGGVPG